MVDNGTYVPAGGCPATRSGSWSAMTTDVRLDLSFVLGLGVKNIKSKYEGLRDDHELR